MYTDLFPEQGGDVSIVTADQHAVSRLEDSGRHHIWIVQYPPIEFTGVPKAEELELASIMAFAVDSIPANRLWPGDGRNPSLLGNADLRNTNIETSDATAFRGGISESEPTIAEITRIELGRAVPNPFSETTRIDLNVTAPGQSDLSIRIYDVSGRLVRNLGHEPRSPGTIAVVWDGKNNAGNRVQSGIYLLRVAAEGVQAASSRIIYLR